VLSGPSGGARQRKPACALVGWRRMPGQMPGMAVERWTALDRWQGIAARKADRVKAWQGSVLCPWLTAGTGIMPPLTARLGRDMSASADSPRTALLRAFGSRLRALREDCKITQKDLAEHAALSNRTVSAKETGIGAKAPELSFVERYVAACMELKQSGVPVDPARVRPEDLAHRPRCP